MTGLVLQHDGLSRPAPSPDLVALSLGAGVQSTSLALMAERGDLPRKPDVAFFSDTGDETEKLYRHLEWLRGQLSFPVVQIKSELGLIGALRSGDDSARIPCFVGAGGLSSRQCTRNYKIRPIKQAIRDYMGVGRRGYIRPKGVEIWIGISIDEIARVKPSGVAWLHNRHPLIEARMSRRDCIRWTAERQLPRAPKSSCRSCAFRGNESWLEMREEDPADFAAAVSTDEWLREPAQVKRFRGELYIHHSRQPLAQADLTAPTPSGFDFGQECEGMCGV